MKRFLATLAALATIVAILLLLFALKPPQPVEANSCAMELIRLVNQMRAQHGLPPYRVNPILMAVAQAHSDYQADTHTMTHIGPGGTHPRDRARAAGYGGGATVFVSENIAWGYTLSPAAVIQMWTEDQPHLNTMLGPNYRDVGAGCAKASDGATYYTLDAGYYIGEPSNPTSSNGKPYPTATVVLPVAPYIRSTPRPDGAIIHIVRYGHTLYGISKVYGVPLKDLLKYNHLTLKSTLYVGEKIIVRPPQATPTFTPTATPKPTSTPTPTQTAMPTPSPSATKAQTTPLSTATSTPTAVTASADDKPKGGIILLGFFAAFALIVGAYAGLKWLAQFGE